MRPSSTSPRRPGPRWRKSRCRTTAPPTVPPSDVAALKAAKAAKRPAVTGAGWATVLEFPAGTMALPGQAKSQDGAPDPATANPLQPKPSGLEGTPSGAAALLEQAAVAVPGGRLVSTSLVNVLILDDGRILVRFRAVGAAAGRGHGAGEPRECDHPVTAA